MKKRHFLKTIALGTAGLFTFSSGFSGCLGSGRKPGLKNWAWVHPNQPPEPDITNDEWKKLLGDLKKWSIDSVLLLTRTNSIIEQVLPIAKQAGIELHAWIISLEWPDSSTMKEHPQWYVVNVKGESCIEKPPYINDYRWLCPTNPEVLEFMKKRITELCSYNELAGVHLDYIRYPDVVLAAAHRVRYDIPQDELVHPQFDYCYCDRCRSEFRQLSGTDPLTMQDQATNEAWLNFRYNSLTKLVNELYETAHKGGKILSAAVFPTPGLARMRVRQDWVKWKLDCIMPMIYQKYENKQVEWIGTAVNEGVEALSGKLPLYSGLHLSQLTPVELGNATSLSLKAGASGIALFTGNKMNNDYWKYLGKEIN